MAGIIEKISLLLLERNLSSITKEIDNIIYMNDGDWVESCTALVEHHDGTWEIVTWTKENDNVVVNNNSSSRK